MTATTLNCDIFISVKTTKSQTIVSLQGIDEIHQAIQYFLLGLLGYCLSLVSQMSDKPVEMLAWCQVAIEWGKIYAIELARVILCEKVITLFL